MHYQVEFVVRAETEDGGGTFCRELTLSFAPVAGMSVCFPWQDEGEAIAGVCWVADEN